MVARVQIDGGDAPVGRFPEGYSLHRLNRSRRRPGVVGLVQSLATALGEEIGWRGFLVPELFKTMGFTSAALFSGVAWACWHYPLVIWGDCSGGTPVCYGLTCFTVLVVAILWYSLGCASGLFFVNSAIDLGFMPPAYIMGDYRHLKSVSVVIPRACGVTRVGHKWNIDTTYPS